ncbi:hypothetical protein AYO47_04600 [Planctomyces sp. SCGC AG-212-M04]|nr:hypothetical protein AYO47_04600 [Planctomyces sp. SCGC AG-212-M04]
MKLTCGWFQWAVTNVPAAIRFSPQAETPTGPGSVSRKLSARFAKRIAGDPRVQEARGLTCSKKEGCGDLSAYDCVRNANRQVPPALDRQH